MSEIEIAPCPDTGLRGEVHRNSYRKTWEVRCPACPTFVWDETKEEAIEKWNHIQQLRERNERLVAEFGESYRRLIESSMDWLDAAETRWGLDKPINRRSFIRDLISRATK